MKSSIHAGTDDTFLTEPSSCLFHILKLNSPVFLTKAPTGAGEIGGAWDVDRGCKERNWVLAWINGRCSLSITMKRGSRSRGDM